MHTKGLDHVHGHLTTHQNCVFSCVLAFWIYSTDFMFQSIIAHTCSQHPRKLTYPFERPVEAVVRLPHVPHRSAHLQVITRVADLWMLRVLAETPATVRCEKAVFPTASTLVILSSIRLLENSYLGVWALLKTGCFPLARRWSDQWF